MKTKKQVDAILAKGIYSGYMQSDFHLLGYSDFVKYCHGRLILAVGEGKTATEMSSIVQMSISWGNYQKLKRELYEKNKIAL